MPAAARPPRRKTRPRAARSPRRRAVKVTFEVPPDLKQRMEDFDEVNWSAVLREAVERHARRVEIARRIQEEEEDPRIRAVAASLRKGVGERFRRAMHARRG